MTGAPVGVVGMLDWPRCPPDWPERVRAAAPWVDVFILRAKLEPAARQWELARSLIRAVPDRPVLVADRADVAQAAGAAGVHLPGDGLSPAVARRLWPTAVISRSVHNVADASAAQEADWLLFGHLFPTRSKPGAPPRGWELAQAVLARATVPVVGIGGITADTAAEVRAAGFDGVAVVDALWQVPDSAAAARKLAAAWHAASHGVGMRSNGGEGDAAQAERQLEGDPGSGHGGGRAGPSGGNPSGGGCSSEW